MINWREWMNGVTRGRRRVEEKDRNCLCPAERALACVPLSALSQNRVNCVHLGTTTEQKTKEKKRTDSQLKCRRTTTLAPIALSLLHAHLLAHPFVFSHIQKLPLNSFVASSSVSCLLLSVRFFNRAYLRILLRYSRLMSTVFKDCRQ
jgi:hypothetical protein